MKDIEAVIFDMDGVIYDTEAFYLKHWIQVFYEYGYKMTKDIYINAMGRGRKKVKEYFKSVFGDDLPIDEMYVKKDKLLFDALKNREVPLKSGALELLQCLKDNNIKIALATSAKRERLDIQLKNSPIVKYFDAIVCGDDVVNSKPDPEIFLKAAKLVGADYKKCIVIEDSEAGIKAAHDGNMIGFHVEDLKVADENIKKNASKLFKNLVEVKRYIMD
ncbi:MAG: HAD family phosphatase [Clostridium sp.]|nr:HAD family phosphatase [Clostridium sp.]